MAASQQLMPHEDFERALIGWKGRDKRARRAADLLQRDLLEGRYTAGKSLGTFQEIRERLGIGRWACREAVGILELRGIASPRPGPGGGLVAAAPSFKHLANLMLLHLSMKHSLTDEIIAARQGVWRALVRKLVATKCVPSDFAGFQARAEAGASAVKSEDSRFLRWLADKAGGEGVTFLCKVLEAIYDACETFPRARDPRLAIEIDRMRRALWAAICQEDLSEAQDVLARYLSLTEVLPSGERVARPDLDRDVAPVGSAKSARRLATELLDELVRTGASESPSLGSELEIGVRYNHNGQIVRQAVRLLEDLGVVAPQRGGAGGVNRREPDIVGIVRLMPHLIHREEVSPEGASEAILLLKVELAACAAHRVIREGAQGPAALGARAISTMTPDHSFDMISLERGLSELSGNSILVACELGLVISAPPPVDIGAFTQATALESAAQTRRIAEAIGRGDPASAEQAMLNRCNWLVEQYG